MALDQYAREWISADLASLCEYEMEEAISGRNADRDLQFFGCTCASARQCKTNAEMRMQILPSLGCNDVRWQDDYVQIRDCIKRLDAYIAEQVEGDETS